MADPHRSQQRFVSGGFHELLDRFAVIDSHVTEYFRGVTRHKRRTILVMSHLMYNYGNLVDFDAGLICFPALSLVAEAN